MFCWTSRCSSGSIWTSRFDRVSCCSKNEFRGTLCHSFRTRTRRMRLASPLPKRLERCVFFRIRRPPSQRFTYCPMASTTLPSQAQVVVTVDGEGYRSRVGVKIQHAIAGATFATSETLRAVQYGQPPGNQQRRLPRSTKPYLPKRGLSFVALMSKSRCIP